MKTDIKPLEKKAVALVSGARQANPNPGLTETLGKVADLVDKPETNPVPQFLE